MSASGLLPYLLEAVMPQDQDQDPDFPEFERNEPGAAEAEADDDEFDEDELDDDEEEEGEEESLD
jgi:hypothetical protein